MPSDKFIPTTFSICCHVCKNPHLKKKRWEKTSVPPQPSPSKSSLLSNEVSSPANALHNRSLEKKSSQGGAPTKKAKRRLPRLRRRKKHDPQAQQQLEDVEEEDEEEDAESEFMNQNPCLAWLLGLVADHDWVMAANVMPRAEFQHRTSSFFLNYGTVTVLVLSVAASCLYTKPEFESDNQELFTSIYGVSMYLSCIFALVALLAGLITETTDNKIPADYHEMIWFAEEAMPYLLALIITPFRLSVAFLFFGLVLFVLADYMAQVFTHSLTHSPCPPAAPA